MMRYFNEGGYHFKITKWQKKDKYEHVVKEWLILDQVFFDETDNPQNPQYLLKMKALHARDLYFRRIETYGYLLGWELRVDKKDFHEPEWRNTEDKVKAVRDAELLKDTVFCFGGFTDSWNETKLGFRPEDRDTKVKELEVAGWKVSFEGEKN